MFQNFKNFKVEIFQSDFLAVLGFCETHLTDDIQSLYMLPIYNYYAANIVSNKGGVCLFVRKKHQYLTQYLTNIKGSAPIFNPACNAGFSAS